jgi:DnaK suppressor protein
LHKTLVARKTDILKKLREDLHQLRNQDSSGDCADAAFEAGSEEMASHLAELDSRELGHIERALVRLKQGTYGLCECCSGKIPIGRLNALPYTTMCIECQRENEQYPSGYSGRNADWGRVYETAIPLEDQREIRLTDFDLNPDSR